MAFIDELMKIKDEGYADFQAKLTPNVDRSKFIGVRVPDIRKLAKTLLKSDPKGVEEFLDSLPHDTYDEDMLHGVILSEIKDFDTCIRRVDEFLPYVDNWAVCDIMSPKVFKKHKAVLLPKIREWVETEHVYVARFGVEMLMSFYLDEDFEAEYLEIPIKALGDDYYIKMMLAWFYATALAKQWDATIPYLENHRLAPWTHNKTIQKARESYRISDEQKAYLKGLKV